jgi:hypothetical protein
MGMIRCDDSIPPIGRKRDAWGTSIGDRLRQVRSY